MSLTTLQVFSQYAYTVNRELIAQQVGLFNEASRGAIVLKSAKNQGDYSDVTFYQRLVGLVRRRNAYANDDAVTEKQITQLLNTSVKVAGGTPPIRIDQAWWDWIARSPEEAGAFIGKQLGEDTMADMLNTAIKAAVAAISNLGATVVYDGSAGTLTLNALNRGAGKFGDRSGSIAAWLMHSKAWHDLVDASLTNTAQLFSFGTVKVMSDGMGRPFIVTDAADLFNATPNPDQYNTLGLVQGAAIVEQNPDFNDNLETSNGTENIRRTYQAEWSYNLGLKGYTWNKTDGGKSPTNAAIGTGTNWPTTASSIKDTAGVMVKSQ